MQTAYFIQQLESQADAFEALIASMPPEMLRWKQDAESWSVTETVGHLLYEERNDFLRSATTSVPAFACCSVAPGSASRRSIRQVRYRKNVSMSVI